MRSCLIADDHVLMREALVSTVRVNWPDAVVTEVGDFVSAWKAAAAAPHVAIVDLMMPGALPVAGIRGLREASPSTEILVVTGTDDDRLFRELLDLGVAGIAPKTSSGSVIGAAVRLVLSGERYLPTQLAALMASSPASPRRSEAAQRASFTDRQLAVLRLVAAGLSNKEIAQQLGLSPATVKTHLAHAQAALGAKNRTDAAMRARTNKMLL